MEINQEEDLSSQEQTETLYLEELAKNLSFLEKRDWIAIPNGDIHLVAKALDLGGAVPCSPGQGILAAEQGPFCYLASVPGYILVFQNVKYAEVEDEEPRNLLQTMSVSFGEAQWFHCSNEQSLYIGEKYKTGTLLESVSQKENGEEEIFQKALAWSVAPAAIFQQPAEPGLVGIRHFSAWKKKTQEEAKQIFLRKANQSSFVAAGFAVAAAISFLLYLLDSFLSNPVTITVFLMEVFGATALFFIVYSSIMSSKAEKNKISALVTVEQLLPKSNP